MKGKKRIEMETKRHSILKRGKGEKISEEIIREEARFKETGQREREGRGCGISLVLDWMGY